MPSLVAQLGADKFAQRASADRQIRAALARDYMAHEAAVIDGLIGSDEPEVIMRLAPILEEAATFHHFSRTNKGYIGVTLVTAKFTDGAGKLIPAVQITSVYSNTPASRAGLRTNDMIVALDDKRIEPWMQNDDFIRQVQRGDPGDSLQLHIARNDGIHKLRLTLGDRPASVSTAARGLFYRAYYGQRTPEDWYERWLQAHRIRYENRREK